MGKEKHITGLQIFKNEQFGEVRTIEEDGKILFCGSDCAKALGYSRANDAISQHCRYTVKHRIPTKQGNIADISFIPEGDLYRLITHSKLPAAEKFESWVFDEVLPSIRKHGMYATDELLNDPDLLISVAQELKKEKELRRELQEKVEQDKPKTLFADAVSASSTSILIGELAKILKGNGYNTGEKRLFAKLREEGYLIKRKGTDYNMPTQKSMELGLFEVKETAITHADGHVTVNKTTKVTGKGQQYFIDKFLAEKAS